jgi:hypothetical protein
MFRLHWSMLWFGLVVLHPQFVTSNSLIKHIFSFIRDVARTDSFSSLGTHCAHTIQNFERSCTMLYAKPWEHTSAVATLSIVLLLSARINSSTCCTVASVTAWTGQPGWPSSATFECPWEFLDPVVNRFTQKMLPTINTKPFFINIPCIESFCPQKTHNTTLLFGGILLKHSHHFDYNLWTCTCVSAT